ncbi:hypothetical protein SeMB42_g02485 [Synchytrium endobioticum]|uniref:Long-chain-alcohol oxidase n=1 Tax=Synchytrium endobioticum TaxID=286115 RepID=A0A507DG11_9FUNG|nr:hypothetical protein SeLEV6574_g03591 [Synchytrium endobioticum]TPX49770.1 hypothetical protein SeMB42_g02485 [Synchytrium endobioticum]
MLAGPRDNPFAAAPPAPKGHGGPKPPPPSFDTRKYRELAASVARSESSWDLNLIVRKVVASGARPHAPDAMDGVGLELVDHGTMTPSNGSDKLWNVLQKELPRHEPSEDSPGHPDLAGVLAHDAESPPPIPAKTGADLQVRSHAFHPGDYNYKKGFVVAPPRTVSQKATPAVPRSEYPDDVQVEDTVGDHDNRNSTKNCGELVAASAPTPTPTPAPAPRHSDVRPSAPPNDGEAITVLEATTTAASMTRRSRSASIDKARPANKRVLSDAQITALTALVDTFISPLTSFEADILVESHTKHLPPPLGETPESYRQALESFAALRASDLGAVDSILKILAGGPKGFKKKEHDRVVIRRLLSCLVSPALLRCVVSSHMAPKKMEWKPFSSLDRNVREAVVLGLNESPMTWIREAMVLVQSMTFNAFYSKATMPGMKSRNSTNGNAVSGAGEKGRKNPAWRVMAYEGPAVECQVQSGRSDFTFVDIEAWGETQRQRNFEAGGGGLLRGWRHERKPIEFECDVVVVGSGAGGSVVAAEVSKSGFRVIVVEKGRGVDMEAETMFEGDNMLHSKDLNTTVLAGSTWGGSAMVGWNACSEPPAETLNAWSSAFGLPKMRSDDFRRSIQYVQERVKASVGPASATSASAMLRDGAACLDYAGNAVAVADQGHDPGCFLKDAAEHGAMFMEGVRAIRVVRSLTGSQGTATGVEGVLTTTGRRILIRAFIVVVAAGALGTPGLLAASGLRNGHIGKNLALFPSALVLGTATDRVVERVDAVTYECTEATNTRIVAGAITPEVLARMSPWVSSFHHKLLMARYHHVLPLMVTSTSRDVAQGNGIDTGLSSRGLCRISADVSESESRNLLKGVLVASALAVGAGASRVWSMQAGVEEYKVSRQDKAILTREAFWNWQGQVQEAGLGRILSVAQSGTCRMAGSEELGAVNAEGETFETANLFVADSSLLPTPPGVGPLLTTWALAHMISQSIKTRLGHVGGVRP